MWTWSLGIFLFLHGLVHLWFVTLAFWRVRQDGGISQPL